MKYSKEYIKDMIYHFFININNGIVNHTISPIKAMPAITQNRTSSAFIFYLLYFNLL
jgi:hypothetical protein